MSKLTGRRLGDQGLRVSSLGLGCVGMSELYDTRLPADWWDDVIRAEPTRGRRSALLTGVLGPGLCEQRVEQRAGHTTVASVLESGTYDTLPMAAAMQADKCLHAQGDLASPEALEIEQRTSEAFCQASSEWREKVLVRADEVVARALAGIECELTATGGPAR